jgi:sugar/nucleoside kinase (ribokinase family)
MPEMPEDLYVFIGGMRQDYCITHDGQAYLGMIGGNAVYAAVGAAIWDSSTAIISRVGIDYPEEWLKQLQNSGINLTGVRVLPEAQDTRTFYVYPDPNTRIDTNPAKYFLELGIPLPNELKDYQTSTEGQDSRTHLSPLAVRPEDISPELGRISNAHLAPADYLSHSILPIRLKERGARFVTLDPSRRYMQPGFRTEVEELLSGLDAFLPSEAEATSYFQPNQPSIVEMLHLFGDMGCRWIVIKCGGNGQFIFDSDSSIIWHVPAYPSRIVDVTGAGDAFCGGFLVGLHRSMDPLEATMLGNVSASMVIEGTGALYALQSAPGLAAARLEALRESVRKI